MIERLYQGIEGEIDASHAILAETKREGACGEAAPRRARSTDTLREECGVVAIHGHPDAARQAYLGLYALQHRGQESAGIATADGYHLANIKGMGLVSEI
ncbi:MAG: amidophosphoribosyltransferase, partial [Terracidiphilus sp.]